VPIDYRQASEKEIDPVDIAMIRATIVAILKDLRAIAIVDGLRTWLVKTSG
jgi:hypothetical protein